MSEPCDSLDQYHVPLTPAQDAELDRRIATADDDLADSVAPRAIGFLTIAILLWFVLAIWPSSTVATDTAILFDPDSSQAGAPEALISGGVKFRIPAGYVHQRTRTYGAKDGIDLWMLWPGLVPLQAHNAHAFKVPGSGARLDVSIKIDLAPQIRSVYLWRLAHPEWLRERKTEWLPDDYDQRQWHENVYGLSAGFIDFEKVAEWFSLKKDPAETHLDKFDKASCDDIFVYGNAEKKISSLIRCTSRDVPDIPDEIITGKTAIPVPHCDHDFVVDDINARINVHYRRIYLPYWKEIEGGVRTLLIRFNRNAEAH